jgi:hypothetical protein
MDNGKTNGRRPTIQTRFGEISNLTKGRRRFYENRCSRFNSSVSSSRVCQK